MIFGTCKLHTTSSNVMQILCKFCHNKHNMLDGATYDQHDCRRQTTWKKIICCTPANSLFLITSATNNIARVQMSTASWTTCSICPLFCISSSTRATFAAVFTGRRRLRPVTPSTGNPASIVWWVGQGLICTKLCWQIPSESGEGSNSFPPVTPL